MNSPAQDDTPPYGIIANALLAGNVVPFLGAGASAIYRPNDKAKWDQGKDFLPFGPELARKLARDAAYPEDPDAVSDLALVASYYEHVEGDRPKLNLALRQVFSREYRPGTIHTLLARVDQPLLMVTTNYDDLIERAFMDRAYHLVIDRGDKNRVWVVRDDGLEPVKSSELRKALLPDDRPVIYKLHGTVDKDDAKNDSFLITEQDYVDFLGRAQTCVPTYLANRMSDSSFLFLGYSLTDWNVRVMLRKLRRPGKAQDNRLRSWAVNRNPAPAERKIWEAHKVNIYDLDLKAFVRGLAQALAIDLDEPAD